VGLSSLTLGGCRSLAGLELSSSSLSRLDLRGCGQVQQLLLDCPKLQIMDATFCSGLSDAGLATAVAGAPPLAQLVLSVCCQVSVSCVGSGKEDHRPLTFALRGGAAFRAGLQVMTESCCVLLKAYCRRLLPLEAR
jgi:hypothetical protein